MPGGMSSAYDELIRRLAEVPDWVLTMSNHTVAVSAWWEFHMTRGEFAKVKEEARCECIIVSLAMAEVRQSLPPAGRKGH